MIKHIENTHSFYISVLIYTDNILIEDKLQDKIKKKNQIKKLTLTTYDEYKTHTRPLILDQLS